MGYQIMQLKKNVLKVKSFIVIIIAILLLASLLAISHMQSNIIHVGEIHNSYVSIDELYGNYTTNSGVKEWLETHDKLYIRTEEQLKAFRSYVNVLKNECAGKEIILLTDIKSTEQHFGPIGLVDAPFAGVFNGNGYKIVINGYCIRAQEEGSIKTGLAGIFGVVDTNGKVINLQVEQNASVNMLEDECHGSEDFTSVTHLRIGGIAAMNYGVIENCKVNAKIKHYLEQDSVEVNIGGIVGNNTGTIRGCNTYGSFHTDEEGYAGGIAGWSIGTIEKCKNSMEFNSNVYNQPPWITAVGGIVGGLSGTESNPSKIENCFNEGDVIAPGTACVGGIVGISFDAGLEYLIYYEYIKTSDCVSRADKVVGRKFVGGIAGYAFQSMIENCTCSRTSIEVTDKSGKAGGGGILGFNSNGFENTLNNAKIQNCLAIDGIINISSGRAYSAVVGDSSLSNGIYDCVAYNMNSSGELETFYFAYDAYSFTNDDLSINFSHRSEELNVRNFA